MPTPPNPFLALWQRIGNTGPTGSAGQILDYVYGGSGSPPGSPHDHFCPTRNEDGTTNFDPTLGAWFNLEFPNPNSVGVSDWDGNFIDYLEPNDPRVAWDSDYSNYYAAAFTGLPPGTCESAAVGLGYPVPANAIFFINDFDAVYPFPINRSGFGEGGFGVFFCPEENPDGMGGGGTTLSQAPVLVYRQIGTNEDALAGLFPDPEYWWTCYYCPDGYAYSTDTGMCEETAACPDGEYFCALTGLCMEVEFPTCSEERGCVFNATTCLVDCTPLDEMCPPGQIFNEGTCSCDSVPPATERAGTWTHEIVFKLRLDRSDVFFPTGDRELRYSFVGQRPLIETVILTASAHSSLSPPAETVAMILEPEGAVLLRLKGVGGDVGVRITPSPDPTSIPAFVPLAAGAVVVLYNGHTAAQQVRIRWLRGLQEIEEEPI